MLKRIDKQYLIDCGFEVFNSENGEKLKGIYPFVNLYNDAGEITDLISVEIILTQENNHWFIEKCYTEGEQKDVFDLLLPDNKMKSLIEFHRLNNINI